MKELDFPVIATSGNLSDEPICIDNDEALTRLSQIADCFLIHNRSIARHVDDSIVRVLMSRPAVVRRARGLAPLPLPVETDGSAILSVGAHLKNAIALSSGPNTFVSQHIGDLETPEAMRAFRNVIKSFESLYDVAPEIVACDEHPDYLSTKFANTLNIPQVKVQHHYAHILSCMNKR